MGRYNCEYPYGGKFWLELKLMMSFPRLWGIPPRILLGLGLWRSSLEFSNFTRFVLPLMLWSQSSSRNVQPDVVEAYMHKLAWLICLRIYIQLRIAFKNGAVSGCFLNCLNALWTGESIVSSKKHPLFHSAHCEQDTCAYGWWHDMLSTCCYHAGLAGHLDILYQRSAHWRS